ncbi:hypothetical protein N657DRAFT_662340 [Parathielavia appendiculata]|uniref:Uncharacterized protein n=1 Tax=Parathielavia appendiculata TaxID=2587402 RepID=A0AAN6U484_9PEZI|nr:hypothetical protein N657DRAFT_662340 [Parathielavia appendiculata]
MPATLQEELRFKVTIVVLALTDDEARNTIIVGIDFRTTYSGLAFTWFKKIDRVEVISSWDPDLHSSCDEAKASTAISFGSKTKWFKLVLVADKDLPADVRKSAKVKGPRAYLKKHNKMRVGVVAELLRLLWNYCTHRIAETVSRNLINCSKFHVRMRDAVRQAGMLADCTAGETTLAFISEPEAAALTTGSEMEGRQFRVVDCGGGTANLISYETYPWCRALCGAVFVETFLQMEAENRHRHLHGDWDHGIKQTYEGQYMTWTLNMPIEVMNMEEAMKTGRFLPPKVTFAAGDTRSAFDPTIERICSMVDQQVAGVRVKKNEHPKYVIMVGGFGHCRYLFATLKEHLGGSIEVLQPRAPTPICRGAVMHAANMQGLSSFSVDVQARVARVNYGVMCYEEWCPEIRDPRDKAKNQMKWLIEIETVKYSIESLYAAENATKRTPLAKEMGASDVEELCILSWYAKADISSLPTSTNCLGKVFCKLEYRFGDDLCRGSTDFAVYHNDKRQGSKNAAVNNATRSSLILPLESASG